MPELGVLEPEVPEVPVPEVPELLPEPEVPVPEVPVPEVPELPVLPEVPEVPELPLVPPEVPVPLVPLSPDVPVPDVPVPEVPVPEVPVPDVPVPVPVAPVPVPVEPDVPLLPDVVPGAVADVSPLVPAPVSFFLQAPSMAAMIAAVKTTLDTFEKAFIGLLLVHVYLVPPRSAVNAQSGSGARSAPH